MAELETTKELAARYSVPVFKTIDEIFHYNLHVDGIVVSSTHATHYELAAKVIAANKHLLLEKPMTVDPAEAQKLCELASSPAYTGYFQINHSANWRVQTKRARELVKLGAVGKIKHIVCCMNSPLKLLFEDPRSGGWIRLANGESSGFGWGQLTHVVAWALLVTDLEPSEAFCMMSHSEITGADIFNSG